MLNISSELISQVRSVSGGSPSRKGARMIAKEILSTLAGDAGFYRIQFGWLRDVNGDQQPDLVIRVHTYL